MKSKSKDLKKTVPDKNASLERVIKRNKKIKETVKQAANELTSVNEILKKGKEVKIPGALKEVEQPYYYVGLKTTNARPIDIYTDKTYQNKVAHLPANSEIEVLLASRQAEYGYDFLIKSPYGLVGWTTVEGQYGLCGVETIKGICFHGD